MRSNYKKLGAFISKVDKRNKELAVDNLKGLSMTKEFRESTSNIIGTDMSKYKIVDQWQFACDFMSVIRVHAFPVVLNFDSAPVLVSPAYPVFKIVDHQQLDPEYLMMWFRRSEFDRYTDFKCDSAIRGGFGWDELCDIDLPVPSIERQHEIVREYNVVNDRITLNEQITQKLEDTANIIYKQWFLDFDFPITKKYAESIGKPELEGQPYKSHGGEMEFCEAVSQDIPKGWRVINVGQCCSKVIDNRGKTPPLSNDGTKFLFETFLLDKSFPSINEGSKYKYVSQEVYDNWFRAGHPVHLDLLVGTVGNGIPNWGLVPKGKEFCIAQNIVALRVAEEVSPFYLNCFFSTHLFKTQFNARVKATAQPSIRVSDLKTINLLFPCNSTMSEFHSIVEAIFGLMEIKVMGNISLINLKSLLLKTLAKKG